MPFLRLFFVCNPYEVLRCVELLCSKSYHKVLPCNMADLCNMAPVNSKCFIIARERGEAGLLILNHQIMEYWKTTVTILLPLLANIFSYWGLLRSGGLNTRKYWLVEVRRPQYEKILASRGDWEWLYCDSSRGIRWNIAWALLSSQYSYSILLLSKYKCCAYPFSQGTDTVKVKHTKALLSLYVRWLCTDAEVFILVHYPAMCVALPHEIRYTGSQEW